jgi:hypothetical protein
VVLVTGFFLVFFTVYFIGFLSSKPLENSVSYSNNNSNVFNLSIPSELNFCGEDIPTNDFRIKLVLEKEFMQDQYSRSSTQLLFNKAQRWFGYIEPVLKQQGIPDDFKYLAVIESHLSNVHSRAGAAGFWQLIGNSAVNYGLTINATVDERLNVEKATRAACELILEAHRVFKNWTLSAAAYNRGINGILRAMKDQGTRDYHQLLLNPETGTFVYRILAYKTLLSNPIHFGIQKKKLRTLPKIPYKTVVVDSSIKNLDAFAKTIGVDFYTLKAHNPWLISSSLDNPDRLKFEIKIPKNKTADYSNYLLDLNPQLSFAPETRATVVDSLQQKMPEGSIYVETETRLEDLAKQFHVSIEDLRKWNQLDPSKLSVKSESLIVVEPKEAK